jgi:hypothetical protein
MEKAGADAPSRALARLSTKGDLFSEKAEVRVVTEQTEHDEISVESVEAVPGVWVAEH